jgi:hypothetical protein
MRTIQTLFPSLARILLGAALLVALMPARAEPAKFERHEIPVITPATDLVDEYPGKSYPLGQSLLLTRKATTAAQRIRARGFQVRVFPLAASRFEPDPWAFFDPCYVFLSSVIPVNGSADHTINLGQLASPFWLTAVEGRPIEQGRYLLVFEQATDDRSIFRLDKTRKDEYFKSGLYLEVVPARSYSQKEVDELAKATERERPKIERETQVNSPNLPCYRYQVVRVGVGDRQVALLRSCDAEEYVP